jgi:hypothetical protein
MCKNTDCSNRGKIVCALSVKHFLNYCFLTLIRGRLHSGAQRRGSLATSGESVSRATSADHAAAADSEALLRHV